MKEAVIVSGARTPIGAFGGSLKSVSAIELGSIVIKEAVKRAGLRPTIGDQTKEAVADKTNDSRATGYPEVLLIYRPPGAGQEITDPIAIAGGYESKDESTNLYYMLVPPAVIIDAVVIMILCSAYGRM